ncbi:hypothetical protein [Rhodonellum sp.]|uniref:hypothetical protein n=1 Tax=Rhodonellum sp. TaxID=2231180 RepID=UPI0027251052|nr:hypothetical protein [Rhodonellum sp.]MDO9551145.1 hypothetical protein [Rhodonellum sp.]
MKTKQPIAYNALLNNDRLSFLALLLFIFFLSSVPRFSQAFSTNGSHGTDTRLTTQLDIDHSHSNSKESKNLFTWEEQQKEERAESEINVDFSYGISFVGYPTAFYKISGAEMAALKIPIHKGKNPYYLLFHCLKIHLG